MLQYRGLGFTIDTHLITWRDKMAEYEYYQSDDNNYDVNVDRSDTRELTITLTNKTYVLDDISLNSMKIVDKALKAAYLQGIRTAKWQMRCALSEIKGEI